MSRLLLFNIFLIVNLNCLAQGGSEIYLFDLKVSKDKVEISNGENISNHPGYDNQPSFHPDKPLLYYTTAMDTSGLTDIMAYNYSTGESKNFTSTSDREYSPTVTPDKKYISCIIQRADGKQDLGKYPIDGGEPIELVNSLTVGYHTWANQNNLVLFILGDPITLRWFSVADKKDRVLAENIGRSLHRIPGSNDISFIEKSRTAPWTIKKLKGKAGGIEVITQTLPEREDLTWTKDGKIIMSDGSKLFYFQDAKSGWKEVKVESSVPLKGITRLATTQNSDKIAIVIAE